ncbi:hypothetical protein B0H14DRAFT_2628259 [Mycena olivaceomarginata]|nr:hypothetical protein B0H14DRAFT_2628259 [Mycena olivaceomarginata]
MLGALEVDRAHIATIDAEILDLERSIARTARPKSTGAGAARFPPVPGSDAAKRTCVRNFHSYPTSPSPLPTAHRDSFANQFDPHLSQVSVAEGVLFLAAVYQNRRKTFASFSFSMPVKARAVSSLTLMAAPGRERKTESEGDLAEGIFCILIVEKLKVGKDLAMRDLKKITGSKGEERSGHIVKKPWTLGRFAAELPIREQEMGKISLEVKEVRGCSLPRQSEERTDNVFWSSLWAH